MELIFLQFSGYYAYPEPNIPSYQKEYVEHRVVVPWSKWEWEELNGVRTSTVETSQVNPVIRTPDLFLPWKNHIQADEVRRRVMHEEMLQRNRADIDRINPNSFQNTLRYSF